MNLNVCALVGTLARDPRTAFEGEGKQTTSFTVQVQEAGVRLVLYVRVQCFGKYAEQAAELSAEDLVSIEGRLRWQSYVYHGKKRSTLCVVARQITVLQPAELPA
jgi:single-stranded DNA-binding protein